MRLVGVETMGVGEVDPDQVVGRMPARNLILAIGNGKVEIGMEEIGRGATPK